MLVSFIEDGMLKCIGSNALYDPWSLNEMSHPEGWLISSLVLANYRISFTSTPGYLLLSKAKSASARSELAVNFFRL